MKNTDRNNGEIGQTNEVTPDNLDKLVTDVVKLLLIKGVNYSYGGELYRRTPFRTDNVSSRRV